MRRSTLWTRDIVERSTRDTVERSTRDTVERSTRDTVERSTFMVDRRGRHRSTMNVDRSMSLTSTAPAASGNR